MSRKLTRYQTGESIVEILLAISILVLVLIAVFTMLNRSLGAQENIRNRIIALNIAREGIEGVRNIRDTNWLKYSGDKRNKWLCLDTPTTDGCDSSPFDILDDNDQYILTYDNTLKRYFLSQAMTRSETNLQIDTNDRYNHDPLGDNSRFFRVIEFEKLNPIENDTNGLCGVGTSCEQARLKVISRVSWEENITTRSITLEAHLFDFYERDEL